MESSAPTRPPPSQGELELIRLINKQKPSNALLQSLSARSTARKYGIDKATLARYDRLAQCRLWGDYRIPETGERCLGTYEGGPVPIRVDPKMWKYMKLEYKAGQKHWDQLQENNRLIRIDVNRSDTNRLQYLAATLGHEVQWRFSEAFLLPPESKTIIWGIEERLGNPEYQLRVPAHPRPKPKPPEPPPKQDLLTIVTEPFYFDKSEFQTGAFLGFFLPVIGVVIAVFISGSRDERICRLAGALVMNAALVAYLWLTQDMESSFDCAQRADGCRGM
jgi:hypothetical protein